MSAAITMLNRLSRALPFTEDLKRQVKAQVMVERVFRDLDLFVPNSRGTSQMLAEHGWISARQTFPLLAELAARLDGRTATIPTAAEFCTSEIGRANAAQLKQLFDARGSDKGDDHGYHLIYGEVIGRLPGVSHMLEIGIGTPNTALVSHMGAEGRPGASLRAFRDFLPAATVRGADIDSAILFEEDRITTHFVDQRDASSFADLRKLAAAQPYDIIIDDGLHAPDANIAVLLFALDVLAPRGWIIVEDIKAAALPAFQVIRAVLERDFETHLVQAKADYVLLATRRQ